MRKPTIIEQPSPNQGVRRDGLSPSLIVLHYTAMTNAAAAIARLCDPATEVSAHYLISNAGQITRMVPEGQRAWHAGQGAWAGQDDINSRSIGIELDNTGAHPFSDPQMKALETLLHSIMARWDIPPENVIGHSDIAPGRKIDPGPHFDWARLTRLGLAGQTGTATISSNPNANDFRQIAKAAGYTTDVDHATLLKTVRLRHRPFASGPLCAADCAVL
jgi:N-acetylmuramoyl-L-alanine amidase